MKVWISKYALTIGLFEIEAELCEPSWNKTVATMVKYRRPNCYEEYAHGEGREWHRSRKEAEKRAEAMRIRKIQSHQKAIEKLQRLVFNG